MDILLVIIISLALSAFFAGMEIAFNSSNRLIAKIDSADKSIAGTILSLFYKNSGQFISTMLVGCNIVLVIYSIAMARVMDPYIKSYITDNTLLISLIQTVIATIIVIFIGEFIPKTIFRYNSNFWLRFFSPVTFVFYIILYPISKLSMWLSVGILRIFGIKINLHNQADVFDKVDLSFLLEETIEKSSNQSIENEIKIFKNALDFSSVKLRECIVPRNEIEALDIETASLEDLRSTFAESGFSKIPIYKDTIDNIIGYIHSSDLFEQTEDWRTLLRKIPVVPETMPANKLMHSLLKEKKSIAVVIDEFGGTAGIVTLEDIMEEIFGEIEDEHDTNVYVLKKTADNEYLISGRLEIDTINRKLNLNLPESDEYVTLAGFLLQHYQKIPKLNESIEIDNWTFKVLQATNNRIELVKLNVK
ncbi:hemolysin [Porphyromonadaceae bacterium COT-184 OH4590]|nr:hemolysin [Porphyromonadaceae bacterium COT-184 OH4590]MDO4727326.1 hemolysin family protein [Porphyromonadaceae bacterium]